MKRREVLGFFFAAIVVGAVCLLVAVRTPSEGVRFAREFLEPVVAIDSETSDGSGVVVSVEGGIARIVTCAHVVCEVEGEITVRAFRWLSDSVVESKSATATVVTIDEEKDLALLEVPIGDLRVARLAEDSDFVLGSGVVSVGCAFGHEPAASRGELMDVEDNYYEDRVGGMSSAPVVFGYSGGPVFTESGKVLGLMKSMGWLGFQVGPFRLPSQSRNWFVLARDVREFLGRG